MALTNLKANNFQGFWKESLKITSISNHTKITDLNRQLLVSSSPVSISLTFSCKPPSPCSLHLGLKMNQSSLGLGLIFKL
jgi:hypothetical protein